MLFRGPTSNDYDLDICYQDHPPACHPKDFSRHSLFIKKLLTKKLIGSRLGPDSFNIEKFKIKKNGVSKRVGFGDLNQQLVSGTHSQVAGMLPTYLPLSKEYAARRVCF